ncbi:MAG TPA: SUMF1/EgtB/PvdO family nonheme iron enzyme [Clostridiales bacterium]|nr:SUMF1/EgtB/PvdO family nonheme iron enzyme [Clostridiales bacterium]HQP68819.1 SUMF1/EgtB/PvdO family nonheme iron enzyme [Clostridiales bacterium]
MSFKLLSVSIVLLMAGVSFGAQFEIAKNIEQITGDLSAQKYGQKDIFGQWCAILKVYSDISDLQFDGQGYEKHDYRDGIYFVYMQQDSRDIIFKKEGYDTKKHAFPFSLNSNTVYGIEIRGTGEEMKITELSVNFTGKPENSEISVDGKPIRYGRNIKLRTGTHELSVSGPGYYKMNKKIEVNTDSTLFNVDLERDYGSEVLVKGSTFIMGNNNEELEKPLHKVTLSDFYIGMFEVTKEIYNSVTGEGSFKQSEFNFPVDSITWYDAVEFCNKLSEKKGLKKCYSGSGENIKCDFSANGYRLPTEAEWEYAAGGGPIYLGYKYSGSDIIDEVAWHYSNSDGRSHPAGTKRPNVLGIYDMTGNVYEWCWDWCYYYKSEYQTDPTGADGSDPNVYSRVLRGSSYKSDPVFSDLGYKSRTHSGPESADSDGGFRIARSVRR